MFYLKIILRLQKNLLIVIAFGVFYSLLFSNCAKEVMPTGGIKDTVAPFLVQTIPQNNSLNFKKEKITFEFNENVKSSSLSKNLIVSPPLETAPQVKIKGKKIIVRLEEEELKSNTTYILNFGDAVEDLNESNKARNLTYAFSTGDIIDSLSIIGKVFDSETSEPLKDYTVILFEGNNDSAVYKEMPLYTAKTNEDGSFLIKNVKNKSYSLYALEDLNNNFNYDKETEAFAFADSLLTPEYIAEKKINDTLSVSDSTTTDTLNTNAISEHVLYAFKHKIERQYIQDVSRPKKERYDLIFSMPLYKDSIVVNNLQTSQFFIERNKFNDSLIIWLNDTALINNDTLCVNISYFTKDSAKNTIWFTDTLCPSLPTKKKEKDPLLQASPKDNSTIHKSENIFFEYNGNVTTFNSNRVKLYKASDSIIALNSKGEFYDTLNIVKEAPEMRRYFNPNQKQEIEKYKFLWSKFYVRYKQDISSCSFSVFSIKNENITDKGILEKDLVHNAIIFWFKDPSYNDGKIPDIIVSCNSGDTFRTDTIRFENRKSRMRKNKLLVDINAKQKENLFLDNYLVLNTSNPIVSIDTSKIHIVEFRDTAEITLPIKILEQKNKRTFYIDGNWELKSSYFLKIDKGAFTDIYDNSNKETQIEFKTQEKKNELLKEDMDYTVVQTDSSKRKYSIKADLDDDQKYQLEILPGAVVDVTGRMNDSLVSTFKTATSDYYSSLTIEVDSSFADYLFILKEAKGKVLQKAKCSNKLEVKFSNLKAGAYKLDYYIDKNNDEQYTTGNFEKKIQPEIIKSYKEKIKIKKSWDNKIKLSERENKPKSPLK